jgi:hypothetical protein
MIAIATVLIITVAKAIQIHTQVSAAINVTNTATHQRIIRVAVEVNRRVMAFIAINSRRLKHKVQL